MNASELYKAGQLQEAIDAQIKEVKAQPANHDKRVFLFELLAFAGELEKAKRQIEAINYGEMERDTAVMSYRRLLDAEEARRRLFSEGLSPKFLADPPEHVRLRLDAVNRLRENRPGEASELLARATEATPPLPGQLNGRAFASLRDCDDLFGPVLEVMAQGTYYWVPLDQVDSVEANGPRFPRDLLWLPVRLSIREGQDGDAFLPVLYPRSHEHADNQVRLGRMTDWISSEGGPVLGVGLRTFLVDDDAIGILEWRQLEMQPLAA
jgi:type VI secretion system protein ImpE